MNLPVGPCYFVNSFWGAAFREYFLRISTGSLIAAHNLPLLSDKENSRYLVCTTRADWDAIQDDPAFREMTAHITAEFVELRRSVPEFLKPVIAEQRRRQGLTPPQSAEECRRAALEEAAALLRVDRGAAARCGPPAASRSTGSAGGGTPSGWSGGAAPALAWYARPRSPAAGSRPG